MKLWIFSSNAGICVIPGKLQNHVSQTYLAIKLCGCHLIIVEISHTQDLKVRLWQLKTNQTRTNQLPFDVFCLFMYHGGILSVFGYLTHLNKTGKDTESPGTDLIPCEKEIISSYWNRSLESQTMEVSTVDHTETNQQFSHSYQRTRQYIRLLEYTKLILPIYSCRYI